MTTTIVTRSGKGSPLTNTELDANFTNLKTTADAALPAAGGTISGSLIITSNLEVQGTTTSIDSTTVEITDLNITLAKDATNATQANGAGITIAGSNAELKYVSTGDKWTLNKNLSLADSIKLTFGNDDDLEIYHDGNHSRISDLGTGRLVLETNGDSIRLTKGTTENMAIFTPDGSVDLYHNNSKKFETTSGGIGVSGYVDLGVSGNRGKVGFDSNHTYLATTSSVGSIIFKNNVSSADAPQTSGDTLLTLADGGNATFSGSVATSIFLKSIGADTQTNVMASQQIGIHLQNTSNTDGNFVPIDFYNSTGFVTARIGAEFQDAGDRNTDLYFATRVNSGSLAERMRIDSSGLVSIGNDDAGSMHSNANKLVVGTGSGDQGMSVFAGTSTGRYAFARAVGNNTDAYDGGMAYDGNRNLTFHTNNNAERMRIDSAGNLIHGTTNANHHTGSSAQGITLSKTFGGLLSASRSGAQPLIVNRQTSDGITIDVRKNGTSVGGLGVIGGDDLYIAGGSTGLRFDSGVGKIYPTNGSGTVSDNTVDIGEVNYRFKDLHLSGSISSGAITASSVNASGGFLNGSNGGIRVHVSGTKFFNVTAANVARDNIMDIGAADARFKDLHLGGTISSGPISATKQITADEIQYPLIVAGTDVGNTVNQSTSSGIGVQFKLAGNSSSGDSLIGASIAAMRESATDSDSSTGLAFLVSQNDTTLDEALRIDNTGNVGIGITSLTHKLEIAGNAMLNAADAFMYLSNVGVGNAGIYVRGRATQGTLRSHTTTDFRWEIGGSEKAILNGSGLAIGTSTVNAKLHVSDATAPTFRLSRTGIGQIYQMSIDSSGRFLIQEAASEGGTKNTRFVIDDTGEIGLGKAAPEFTLDVLGGAGNTTARFANNAAEDTLVRIIAGNYQTDRDARLFLGEDNTHGMTLEYDGVANIGYIGMNDSVDPTGAYSKRIQMSRAGTEVAFMAGNVGIAVTNPAVPLDVHSNSSAEGIRVRGRSSDNIGQITLTDSGGTARNQIQGSATYLNIKTFPSSPIAFFTGGTERMRLSATGDLGINTTATDSKLHIAEDAFDQTIVKLNFSSADSSAGNYAHFGEIRLAGHSTNCNTAIRSYSNAFQNSNGALAFWTQEHGGSFDERMRILGDGKIGIKNTSPSATLEVGTLTSGQTGNMIINHEGGATPVLQVKSRTNRATISVGDNDTSGFISSENGLFSIGRNSGVNANNINIDASHNVGLGTSAPTQYINTGNFFKPSSSGTAKFVTIDGGTNAANIMLQGNITGENPLGGIYWTSTNGQSVGHRQVAAIDVQIDDYTPDGTLDGANLRFFTKPRGAGVQSPRMTLLSNGNLIFGKTADNDTSTGIRFQSNGSGSFVRDNNNVLTVNRLTGNGNLIELRKDSSLIGAIGVDSGDNLYIAGSASNHAGVYLGTNVVAPLSAGSLTDNAVDIGNSSYRFQDAHFSGTVNCGAVTASGNIASSGVSHPEFELIPSGSVGNADIRFDGTSLDIRSNSNGAHLTLQTATTERMRISNSGVVMIGLTSTGNTDGSFFRQDGRASFLPTSLSGGSAVEIARGSNGTAINFQQINGNVDVGSISVTGTATAYNTSSDARLKDNIEDADDSGETIDAIKVRQYDWKSTGKHQNHGMIAQELQKIVPEAVSGDAESEDMMGIDYSKLVPMLVKEIQSLRQRVAQLEE